MHISYQHACICLEYTYTILALGFFFILIEIQFEWNHFVNRPFDTTASYEEN